jgi:hypothetical protein
MGDDLKFKHQFSCLLSGPSGSGKTSFCIRFLQNLKELCTVPESVAESLGAIVRVAPSPISSWPGRNTFVFTKECQQTLTTVRKNRAS